MTRARIVGMGSHLPGSPLTNADLAALVGPLPPALLPEIGVSRRHWIARPGEVEHRSSTTEMAAKATNQALEQAGVSASDVDLLVISTSSPEYHLPGAATFVLERIGAPRAATIELRSGCTGFPMALDIARTQVQMGRATTVVVVGAEAISPAIVGMVDRGDPRGLSLRERLAAYTFGDGAGAAVLRADSGTSDYAFVQGTLDATLRPGIRIVGGATHLPVAAQDPARMLSVELDPKGSETHGPEVLAACLSHFARDHGLTLEDVEHVVLPEGDAEYFASRVVTGAVDVDPDAYRSKVRQNLEDVGATGSPAVALALTDALSRGDIAEGESVMLVGVEGARYQYAASTTTWPYL